MWESTGELLSCCEPKLLEELITTKGSVNLHIKMWVQGIGLGVLFWSELEEFLQEINAPKWVLKAVRNQVKYKE